MTTNSSGEYSSQPNITEGLTILQLLRRECGQEYTEEDRLFGVFVTELISRLETYNQLVKIIDEAERTKRGQLATARQKIVINPNLPLVK